jgi:hypothetical protein
VNFCGTVRCHISESRTSRNYGEETLKCSQFLLYILIECLSNRSKPQSRTWKQSACKRVPVFGLVCLEAPVTVVSNTQCRFANLRSQILWRLMKVEIRQPANYFPRSNATHCFRGVTYIRLLPKSIMACRPISGGMHYKLAYVQWRLILEGNLHSVTVYIVGHPILRGGWHSWAAYIQRQPLF